MKKTVNIIGICLLAFVLCCRWVTPVADFYATWCYPAISSVLSLAAAVFPFSLEEITVIGFVAAFIAAIVRTVRRHTGFLVWLRRTSCIAMWLIVWFYMGWGNNYFRTPLFERLGIEKASYQKEAFVAFLTDYTAILNESSGQSSTYDKDKIQLYVNEFYGQAPAECGYSTIHRWQRVSRPLFNPLYSAVGVLGFMGPFFSETQLNLDLTDVEYPFVLAHETAHLAGVTSEAEANYWGFVCCRKSDNPAVRYSGYLALLPYVASQAKALLSEDEFEYWKATLSSKAVDDNDSVSQFWREKRIAWVGKLQNYVMDTFLKTNKVKEGAADYRGVIGILMTMDRLP